MTTPEEPEKRACAVCAKVLNSLVDPEGNVTWVHSIQDEYDHPAVPVEQDEVQTEHRCDFCNDDETTWVLPSYSFPVPGQPGVLSGENWSACDGCARLIDMNQWSALLRRVEDSWVARHGEFPEATKTGLSSAYRVLRKNISGPLRPFERPGHQPE